MKCSMPEDGEIYDLEPFESIKGDPEILGKIKLDVTPRMIMEPRYQQVPEDLRKLGEIAGYMFYVESQCDPPALMLLKTSKTDITSTIAHVDNIPADMVRRAVETPIEPPVNGMYTITDEIKDWLKKELGI